MYFFTLCCLPLHRKLESKAPELTLERAVNLLTQDNEDTLICAASLIQNQCFNSADAKKMVCPSIFDAIHMDLDLEVYMTFFYCCHDSCGLFGVTVFVCL